MELALLSVSSRMQFGLLLLLPHLKEFISDQ
jgi:hypothetical protein